MTSQRENVLIGLFKSVSDMFVLEDLSVELVDDECDLFRTQRPQKLTHTLFIKPEDDVITQ